MKKLRRGIYLSALIWAFAALLSSCSGGEGGVKNGILEATKETPEFYPEGGFYKSEIELQIDSAMSGKVIYYTLDGTTPDENSTRYDGPVKLNSQCVVRAVAVSGSEKRYAMSAYDFDLTADLQTHKASPNWQDQVIYFALIDRFSDGDKAINNQNCPQAESDPSDIDYYSGGDLQGLINKINSGYFTNLGITAIWITQPVRNLWFDGNGSGFHGYWASNFTDVDPHYGDIAKYKEFVDVAHANGIYVIQDVIVNHTGDYFGITQKDGYTFGSNYWKSNVGYPWDGRQILPESAPIQLPWKLNDPTILTKDELENNSFYHWYPTISDFTLSDKKQRFDYQMSNLDDINTDNKVVQNLLRGYFRFWIDKVDIDGLRMDTVRYVKPEFFGDFTNSTEDGNKGIREHGKDIGKNDIILFGEGWGLSDAQSAEYTQGSDGKPRMDSMIYFTLNDALRSVFGSGGRTSQISSVLNNRYSSGYLNPDKMVTFVDNHDMTRLRATADDALNKASYMLIMSIPGIPQLYYGCEQDFTESRQAMFQGGYQGPNLPVNSKDYFDTNGSVFSYLKNLIALRKANSVLRNGRVSIIRDSFEDGILVFKTIEGSGGAGKEALIVFNTSNCEKAANRMQTGLTPGAVFNRRNPSVNSSQSSITIGKNGMLSLAVPAQSSAIYIMDSVGTVPADETNGILIGTTYPEVITSNSITVSGVVISVPAEVRIFFDSDLTRYETINLTSASPVAWSKTISLEAEGNGQHSITAAIKTADGYIFSDSTTFNLNRPFTERAAAASEAEGDDTGPDGTYHLPANATFDPHYQDILDVKVSTSGSDIKLKLKMKSLSNAWAPTINNFDHVMFNIFLAKPGTSSTVNTIPYYSATTPFCWDYMYRASGWDNWLYDKENASTNNNGKSIIPAPACSVDFAEKEITFTIRGKALNRPSSLNGWKIYITTWDLDNGTPRDLVNLGDSNGDGKEDPLPQWDFWVRGLVPGSPLVLDDTEVITITIP